MKKMFRYCPRCNLLLTTKGVVASGSVWHAQQARQDRKISETRELIIKHPEILALWYREKTDYFLPEWIGL